ncbi:MAG: Ppx/GppA phosphatase family protein [Puniceicoccaceae bacterium]
MIEPAKGSIVIDVGSNSIKTLALPSHPVATAPFQQTIEVRISQGMTDQPPRLHPEAIERAVEAVQTLFSRAREVIPAGPVRIVGTSALRDAENRHLFGQAVLNTIGHPVEVLSGLQEAQAIAAGLACDPELQRIKAFTALDLGGGSLEIVFRHPDASPSIQFASLDLGAVRLLRLFPPLPNGVFAPSTRQNIQDYVSQNLASNEIHRKLLEAPTLVGTGGAFTISRAILAAKSKIPFGSSSPELALSDLSKLANELHAIPLDRRVTYPGLPPARADIIPIALDIIQAVTRTASCQSILHSSYNLRWGIASQLNQKLLQPSP